MPMDCILMGSRPMVAKEAPTAQAVKDLICKTAGVEDKDWESSYTGNAGGVLTVQSELGEPIHKVRACDFIAGTFPRSLWRSVSLDTSRTSTN
jgi:enoyl reductase-like protein